MAFVRSRYSNIAAFSPFAGEDDITNEIDEIIDQCSSGGVDIDKYFKIMKTLLSKNNWSAELIKKAQKMDSALFEHFEDKSSIIFLGANTILEILVKMMAAFDLVTDVAKGFDGVLESMQMLNQDKKKLVKYGLQTKFIDDQKLKDFMSFVERTQYVYKNNWLPSLGDFFVQAYSSEVLLYTDFVSRSKIGENQTMGFREFVENDQDFAKVIPELRPDQRENYDHFKKKLIHSLDEQIQRFQGSSRRSNTILPDEGKSFGPSNTNPIDKKREIEILKNFFRTLSESRKNDDEVTKNVEEVLEGVQEVQDITKKVVERYGGDFRKIPDGNFPYVKGALNDESFLDEYQSTTLPATVFHILCDTTKSDIARAHNDAMYKKLLQILEDGAHYTDILPFFESAAMRLSFELLYGSYIVDKFESQDNEGHLFCGDANLQFSLYDQEILRKEAVKNAEYGHVFRTRRGYEALRCVEERENDTIRYLFYDLSPSNFHEDYKPHLYTKEDYDRELLFAKPSNTITIDRQNEKQGLDAKNKYEESVIQTKKEQEGMRKMLQWYSVHKITLTNFTNATKRLVFFSRRSESFYYFPFEAWGNKLLKTLEEEFHSRLKRDNKLDESKSTSILYDEELKIPNEELVDFNFVMGNDRLKSTTTLNHMLGLLSGLTILGGLDVSFRLVTREEEEA